MTYARRHKRRKAFRVLADLIGFALLVGVFIAGMEMVSGDEYPAPLGHQLADEYSRSDFTPPEWRQNND